MGSRAASRPAAARSPWRRAPDERRLPVLGERAAVLISSEVQRPGIAPRTSAAAAADVPIPAHLIMTTTLMSSRVYRVHGPLPAQM